MGGGGGGSSGASCATDGSSASYTETIATKSGVTCARSFPRVVPTTSPTAREAGSLPATRKERRAPSTEATEQSLSVEVPANPKLKSSFTAEELDCSMGTVAYALSGVGFYSGAVAFDSGGNCPQLDVADATAEWISFRLLLRAQHGLRRLPLPFPAVVSAGASGCGRTGGHNDRERTLAADWLGAGWLPDVRGQ